MGMPVQPAANRVPLSNALNQDPSDSSSDQSFFYELYAQLSPRGFLKPNLWLAVFDLCARYPYRRLTLDRKAGEKRFDILVGYSDRTSQERGYRFIIVDRENRLFVGEIDERGVFSLRKTDTYISNYWFLEIDAEHIRSNMTPEQWEAFQSDPLARVFDEFLNEELKRRIASTLRRDLEAEDPSLVSASLPRTERRIDVRLGGSYYQGVPWEPERMPGLYVQIDVTNQERLFPFGEGWSFAYGQLLRPKGARLHEISWLKRYTGFSGHFELYFGSQVSLDNPMDLGEAGFLVRGGIYLSSGDYFPERPWKRWLPDLVVDPVPLYAGATWDHGDLHRKKFDWRPTAWLRINFP